MSIKLFINLNGEEYRLYSFMEVLELEQNNPDASFEAFGPRPLKNIGWWEPRDWYNTFWIKSKEYEHEWEVLLPEALEETLEDRIYTREAY